MHATTSPYAWASTLPLAPCNPWANTRDVEMEDAESLMDYELLYQPEPMDFEIINEPERMDFTYKLHDNDMDWEYDEDL